MWGGGGAKTSDAKREGDFVTVLGVFRGVSDNFGYLPHPGGRHRSIQVFTKIAKICKKLT